MKADDQKYWRDTIKNCERFYEPKHTRWKKLISIYNLEMKVSGLEREHLVKVSTFFPMVRKLIASIAFNYPKVFLNVDDEPFEFGSEVLERLANEALDVMRVKPEIHQTIFDVLFCYRGWLKIGYNTANTEEVEAPYVYNDALMEDFTFIKRVSPFNLMVDPLVPPNDFSSAQYVIEKMLVPLQFAQNDERFSQFKRRLTPVDAKDADGIIDDLLVSYNNGMVDTSEEEDAIAEAKRLQKMVMLYEIHDRINQRRIVFANDIEEPIEDIEHPFLARTPITQPDPFDPAAELMTGEFSEPQGWLTTNGFPYFSMAFDIGDNFYGVPLMEYVRDSQQLILESLSRRVDLLKKHARISLGNRGEKTANPHLPDSLGNLQDGSVLWVNDPGTALRELSWGNPPADQIQLERDAQFYESKILSVEARNSNTATEASINASEAQLNREWMQVAVVDAYTWIIDNALSVMSDTRYTPNEYILNIAPEGEPIRLASLENYWLQGRRRIDIEAGSMLPLIEQLERDDTLGLFDRLIQLPEVDRSAAVKMMIKAFRKVDVDTLLKDDRNADAMKAAQMELMGWILRGQDPGVQPEEDHQTHLRLQSPEVVQQNPQFAQVPVDQQQMVLAVAQQHAQAHMQYLQQQGGAVGSMSGTGPQGPDDLMSQVQSNAQRVASLIQTNAVNAQNTAQL